ncbi:GNAT family N-acetyltransferase [Candidatus Woesearchaeota archaeon]|nr:GNAT family N-acetyltransferase [Candidatus Woesearchaeota archaeon]
MNSKIREYSLSNKDNLKSKGTSVEPLVKPTETLVEPEISSKVKTLIRMMGNIELKKAETQEEKEACYRLRYEVFKEVGYANETQFPEKRIIDEYDAISTIFMASKNKEVIGTLRVTPPSDLGFKIEEVFDLSRLKCKCNELWESSKIVVRREKGLGALIGLAGILYLFMKKKGVSDLCYMTSVLNEKMYEKMGVVRFDEVRFYPEVNEPAVSLHWNKKNTREPYLSTFEEMGRRFNL